jgi:Poly(ADP-ribose) polymerase catalytic domain
MFPDYHFDELESSVNECLLLHGTSASAVGGIAQNGIDLRLANATGRYGSGIYLAESSIKSNVYTGEQLVS